MWCDWYGRNIVSWWCICLYLPNFYDYLCLQRTSLLCFTMSMVALLVFIFGAESLRDHSEVNLNKYWHDIVLLSVCDLYKAKQLDKCASFAAHAQTWSSQTSIKNCVIQMLSQFLISPMQIVIWLLMFFIGFVMDGSIVLTNLAVMETVPNSLSGSALGLATFSSQLCKPSNHNWFYCLVIEHILILWSLIIVGRSFGAGHAFSHLQQSYGWTSVYRGVATLCIAAATLSGYIALSNK